MKRKSILLTVLLLFIGMNYARSQCSQTSSTISVTECSASYTSPSGNFTWTNPGTYLDTLTNAGGCDSVITILLSFGSQTTSSISPKSCESYTSPSGLYTWTSSGTYSDTIANADGCDSVISISLTILNSTDTSLTISDCSGYTSPSGKYKWTSSGTYYDTLTNNAGCDSVIQVNLTIESNSANLDTTVCNSYTSPSGNYTWTKSGVYTDTLTNSAGCDSVIMISLTVHFNSSASIEMVLCDTNPYTSPSGKYTWTKSGIYYDTIATTAGCDSLLTFDLTFASPTTSSISPKACDSFISPSGKYTWFSSGNYNDTLVNAAGCDSLITVSLTIYNASDTTLNVSACDSYTSPSGKYTWTMSGTYMDTTTNGAGCEHITTVILTILSNGSNENVSACNSYTSPSGKYTWTKSGTYTDTLTNSAGCDSVIVFNLTIKSTSSTLKLHFCDSASYTSPSGTYTWTKSGTYLDTIPNAAGCDSFMTIELTLASSTSASINPDVCDTYTSPSGRYTWTTSGNYTDTLVNAAGCDSVIAISLTVRYKTDSTLDIAVCDSYTSPSGNYTWTKSGTYLDTIANSAGCDSVITVNLTIQSNSATISVSECDSYTGPSGKYKWTTSGTYMDTIANAAGCDSVITINLTILSDLVKVQHTACDSYTSPSGKYTWTTTGVHYDTLTNSFGCDSVISFDLTIRNSTLGKISVLVCDQGSYTSPSGKHTWNTDGTYMDTLTNSVGCDSFLTVDLTFSTSSSAAIDTTVCDAYTSPSGKYTWKTSGTYIDTIANVAGCDSVITIGLTVLYSSTATISPIVCDAYTSPSGKNTWTKTGTYTDILVNSAGCDSVITINLTVLNTFADFTVKVCDSLNSPSGKYTWMTSGKYNDTIANSAGCDSIITVNLEVNYTSTSTISVVACDEYTSPSGNYTWTKSGQYSDTIVNKTGCDSIMTINLTVNYSTSETIDVDACVFYVSPSGNYTWTKPGTYTDVITNTSGCDSTITINLTILQPTASSMKAVACDKYISPSGKVWTITGQYLDTITNSVGCDSVIDIFLAMYKSRYETVDVSACGSFTSPNGKIWTSSGQYFDTIPNSVGCDSFITYNLTINQPSGANVMASACDSYTSPSGNHTWTATGTYMDTIVNAKGCDSILTIDLTIKATSSTISPVVCETYTSPGGKVWTKTGTYLDTIPNAAGCDSVITIELTVNKATQSNLAVSGCTSFTSPTGKVWTATGTYHDTIANALGCDSFITFHLTIEQSSSTINPVVCDEYVSPGGKIWTVSGTYLDTIPNGAGCDSVITINLTVNTVDTTVIQNTDTLVATLPGAVYQWLNCDLGYEPVAGETGQEFIPKKDGNYAVQVQANGCMDTSSCHFVDAAGILDHRVAASVLIYPNPTDGSFTIDLLKGYTNIKVRVTDLNGRLIHSADMEYGRFLDVSIDTVPRGVYVVSVLTDEGNFVSRLMKN